MAAGALTALTRDGLVESFSNRYQVRVDARYPCVGKRAFSDSKACRGRACAAASTAALQHYSRRHAPLEISLFVTSSAPGPGPSLAASLWSRGKAVSAGFRTPLPLRAPRQPLPFRLDLDEEMPGPGGPPPGGPRGPGAGALGIADCDAIAIADMRTKDFGGGA